MTDYLNVDLRLKQAISLCDFRADNGKGARIIGMIYFNRLSDGTLWMENIKKDTNPNQLAKLIKEGRIFIVDKVRENEKAEN